MISSYLPNYNITNNNKIALKYNLIEISDEEKSSWNEIDKFKIWI